jgi:hypothetical protein
MGWFPTQPETKTTRRCRGQFETITAECASKASLTRKSIEDPETVEGRLNHYHYLHTSEMSIEKFYGNIPILSNGFHR